MSESKIFNKPKTIIRKSSFSNRRAQVFIEAKTQLFLDLKKWGFRFRPHFWFDSEWYCADGGAGIAVPLWFYHQSLYKFAISQNLLPEDQDAKNILAILRHESGHVFDNLIQDNKNPARQRLFGANKAYPNSYTPDPLSRDYIMHLPDFYAQSHPCEDFAECFAYLLKEGPNWRDNFYYEYYSDKVLAKLEYVEALMQKNMHIKVQNKHKFIGPEFTDRKWSLQQFVKQRQKFLKKSAVLLKPKKRFLGSLDVNILNTFAKQLEQDRVDSLEKKVRIWSMQNAYKALLQNSKRLPAQSVDIKPMTIRALVQEESLRYLRKGSVRYNI